MRARGTRRELVGRVIGAKMEKTVMVEVRTHVTHPKYRKTLVRRRKVAAHDELKVAFLGDRVRIRESRPISKTKRWRLVEVVHSAGGEKPATAPRAKKKHATTGKKRGKS